MARANPPPHQQLPASVLKNKELAGTLERLIFDVFLLWKKVGGGSDFIEEALQGLYEFDDIKKEDVKSQLKKEEITTSSDYQSIGNDVIRCTAKNITITLNDEPEDQEVTTIRSDAGRTYINGNGKNINGESTAFIRRKLTTWNLMYLLNSDEWVIV